MNWSNRSVSSPRDTIIPKGGLNGYQYLNSIYVILATPIRRLPKKLWYRNNLNTINDDYLYDIPRVAQGEDRPIGPPFEPLLQPPTSPISHRWNTSYTITHSHV